MYGSGVGQSESCRDATNDTSVVSPVGTMLVEHLADQRRPAITGVYIVDAASDGTVSVYVINDVTILCDSVLCALT